jgi:hypothetical protein
MTSFLLADGQPIEVIRESHQSPHSLSSRTQEGTSIEPELNLNNISVQLVLTASPILILLFLMLGMFSKPLFHSLVLR